MEFQTFVARLRLGATFLHGPLHCIPLFSDEAGPDAELLEESLTSGHTEVTEVSADGVVGRVRVDHRGAMPLLLLDGEQIVGAKQNRILNSSFLIEPGHTVEVPVSCVERGRWHYRTERRGTLGLGTFDSTETTVAASLRSSKLRRLGRSLRTGRGYVTDQRTTWHDVDGYLERTGVSSRTSAYEDGYRQRRLRVEKALATFEPKSDQAGLAVVYGGKLLSLDVFGTPALYARAWRKLARGLLAEPYDLQSDTGSNESASVVVSALRTIVHSRLTRTKAPGAGATLHASEEGISFTGLESNGAVYHAVATAS